MTFENLQVNFNKLNLFQNATRHEVKQLDAYGDHNIPYLK